MRTYLMLVVFLALWYIPAVNQFFWSQVFHISTVFGIPITIAWEGFTRFRFWAL